MVALLPSYSYSEGIQPYYGYTGNAAADNALRWSMPNVLPSPPGLDIENVIYSYRIQKETGDWVTVFVSNLNANGNGYVFRERDDWKPGSLSGTQINKVVPLGRIHRSLFGDGSIEVQGNGSVTDTNVVYTYRVDPCYDPQFNPACPGYKIVVPEIYQPEYELYDALANGDANQKQHEQEEKADSEEELSEEEKAKLEEEEKRDSKERLEKALAEADRTALFAESLAAAQMLDSLNASKNINAYYSASIPGGAIGDTVRLIDKQLPENRLGLRNGLAQQLLHEKMINSQYK